MRRLAVAAACLIAFATGCNGGDKFPEFSAGASTTVPGGGQTAPGPPTSVRSGTGNAFCDFLRAYNDRFSKFNAGLADPQQLRTTMNEAVTAVKDAEATAPADIKADLTTMRTALEGLVRALEAVAFDVTKLRLDSLTVLQAPNFVQASQRMDAYTRDNCL